jgi:hypothetical protein
LPFPIISLRQSALGSAGNKDPKAVLSDFNKKVFLLAECKRVKKFVKLQNNPKI